MVNINKKLKKIIEGGYNLLEVDYSVVYAYKNLTYNKHKEFYLMNLDNLINSLNKNKIKFIESLDEFKNAADNHIFITPLALNFFFYYTIKYKKIQGFPVIF